MLRFQVIIDFQKFDLGQPGNRQRSVHFRRAGDGPVRSAQDPESIARIGVRRMPQASSRANVEPSGMKGARDRVTIAQIRSGTWDFVT